MCIRDRYISASTGQNSLYLYLFPGVVICVPTLLKMYVSSMDEMSGDTHEKPRPWANSLVNSDNTLGSCCWMALAVSV